MRQATVTRLEEKERFVLARPEDVIDIWPGIRRYIIEANAYGHGKYSEHHILAAILAGTMDLAVSSEMTGALVGNVNIYPLKRVYVAMLFGGEGRHNWDSLDAFLRQRSAMLNCDSVDIYGRPGWRKILKERGYVCTHHVYTRGNSK